MESYKIFFAVFLAFGLIGAIRTGYKDDDFFMHVNVNNDGAKNMDDLKARAYIYDLGIILQTSPFDLGDGDRDGKFISWDGAKGIGSGDYLVRVTVSNDDARRVRHRVITIA